MGRGVNGQRTGYGRRAREATLATTACESAPLTDGYQHQGRMCLRRQDPEPCGIRHQYHNILSWLGSEMMVPSPRPRR
jgi:hypothetical protein